MSGKRVNIGATSTIVASTWGWYWGKSCVCKHQFLKRGLKFKLVASGSVGIILNQIV